MVNKYSLAFLIVLAYCVFANGATNPDRNKQAQGKWANIPPICTGDQLELLSTMGAASFDGAGQPDRPWAIGYTLRNSSRSACSILGTPGFEAVDSRRRLIGLPMSPAPGPWVTLKPDEWTGFDVTYWPCFSAEQMACKEVVDTQFRLLGVRRVFMQTAHLRILGDIVRVTEIQPPQPSRSAVANDGEPTGPYRSADKVVIDFLGSPVAPEYQTAYTVTLTRTSLNLVGKGDGVTQSTKRITERQFRDVLEALSAAGIRTGGARENARCAGGSAESIKVLSGATSLLDASVYHCGGEDYGTWFDDLRPIRKTLGSLMP